MVDHLADRLGVGGQHGAPAGQGVEERPTQHEGHREIDVQIAEVQEPREFRLGHAAGEDEPIEVHFGGGQHVVAEATAAGPQVLVAVVAPPLADAEKDHVAAAGGDSPGDLHEHVEPADLLETAGNVSHDLHPLGDLAGSDLPRAALGRVEPPPQVGVDAVEDRPQLVLVLDRDLAPLEVRWAVARVAGRKVQEKHGIAGLRPQGVHLALGQAGAKVGLAARRAVVPLAEVDDGAVVEPVEVGGRAEAAVPDHQVGPHLGMGLERLVYRVAVPHEVLEGPRAIVVRRPRPAADFVLEPVHAVERLGLLLRDERAAKALVPDEPPGDMPELRRIVLVDVEDVHRRASPCRSSLSLECGDSSPLFLPLPRRVSRRLASKPSSRCSSPLEKRR